MSFNLEEKISELENDLIEEENQLNNLNKLYNQIPKENHFNNPKKDKNKLKYLINASNIIVKIDKINEANNPNDKLISLFDLFQTEYIINPFLKKYIISKLITDDIINLIENSLLNIKYPLFGGKILMTQFEELNKEKKQDLDILSLFFKIYSLIVPDFYKEFPNFGNLTEIIRKNAEDNYTKKFKFIEILPDFLFKKILATIFDENEGDREEEQSIYISKLNEKEKKMWQKYNKLILYINKVISNTSELISLISSQVNNEENNKFNMNKNIMIKYLISNLYEKIILFSISEKTSFEMSNCSKLFIMIFIHKSNKQTDEFNQNYQYDPLKNISFYDLIKYYISNNHTEKDIIEWQKKFDDNYISNLEQILIIENNAQFNNTEEILENISLMIKDIISLFETFKTYDFIDKLLLNYCEAILKIFKKIYNNKIDPTSNKKNISIDNELFLTNLLSNFSLLCNNEFDIFFQRLNLYDKSFRDMITNPLNKFKEKIKILLKDYKAAIIAEINFDNLLQLYHYQKLKEGNDLDYIKKTFDEENQVWININKTFDHIKANKTLITSIKNDVVQNFIKGLSIIALNNIEKSDIEGTNLDILIEKTKNFIENNFMNEDIIDEENKKNIIKLFSYLDNLYLNKKIK